MSLRGPVMTGVMLLGLPRLVVPFAVLAGFGFLLSLCHPPCPIDPLDHRMACNSWDDPQAYMRATEADLGIKRTHAEWQAEADLQERAKVAQAEMDRQTLINDNAASAHAVDVEDRQRCRNGQSEYCRPGDPRPRRHRRAATAAIEKDNEDE